MSSFSTLLGKPADTATAVLDAAGVHSWGDIRARAAAGARKVQTLRQGTVGPRIGLLLDPGADWVSCFVAVAGAGAVAVPLSKRDTDRELGERIAQADASLLVSDTARALPLSCPRISVEAFLSGSAGVPPAPEDEAVAMLLFTSGTTGRPKAVVLRHRQLAHQIGSLMDAWALAGRRALVHALPLHHMHGIGIALLPCLCAGMQVRLLPRFDAREVWDALCDADTLMAVPTMVHRLVDAFDAADPETRARWRAAVRGALAISGSAALPVSLAERWRDIAGHIPLERWGMSELGVGFGNPLDPQARRLGWVGTPLGGLEACVVDGELWVRGPGVFDGYWQDAAANAEAFRDGWFRTGDAVERDGHWLRILGRRSVDIIKCGGNKVSALEIEEQLRQHEAVEDVAVVGIPDPVLGERIEAAVVARCPVAPEALEAWARTRLAVYKVPRRFVLCEALPRNAVGKVLKPALAAALARDPADA